MDKIILFIYLVLFPFGQLLRASIFNASDIVAGLAFIYMLFKKRGTSKVFSPLKDFLFIASFSLLLSVFNFKSLDLAVGVLYLTRVVLYFYFFKYVLSLIKENIKLREVILNSLIAVSFATALFGWLQYFIYPDLTSLRYLGWDDHLFRLVGTFLDPGFTSLIIVFGGILSMFSFIKTNKMKFLLLTLFFILSLAFTYARAGYVAFALSLFAIGMITKRMRLGISLFIILLGIIYFLPRPLGEGVNLARMYSVSLRVENYKDTLDIFKESPVFGVGFNNICLAKKVYLGRGDLESHSCSGSDSSLLLILATTGIVGLMVFAGSIIRIIRLLPKSYYSNVFLVLLVAVFAHSLFVNSLFYPWIMGYLAISASLVEE